MEGLIRFYRLLNTLSIDVCLGAICCAAWFTEIFEAEVKPYAFVTLGLTVWIIYTLDHLIDARKIRASASTERHRYHQRHFTRLASVLAVVIIIDFLFLFYLKEEVFKGGIILSGIVIFYFAGQQYLGYMKEFLVAILFTGGVLLPSVALSEKAIDMAMIVLICQFILTALINLLLFSWFDRYNDQRDRRASFVTKMGEKNTRRFLGIIFIINFLLMVSSIAYPAFPNNSVVIVFFMNSMLAWMFMYPQVFEKNERFRLVGDVIFLLPVVYLLV